MIPKIEKSSSAEIKVFQEQIFLETLAYVSAKSNFYQKLYARENIDIQKIKSPFSETILF